MQNGDKNGQAAEIVFITGGARSGKSSYAQQLALQRSNNPVYIATAIIWDEDFEARVQRHQAERDERWTNYEEQRYVSRLPVAGRVCVVDCVTLWLTNFFADTGHNPAAALELFRQEVDALCRNNAVYIIISNELGMGMHAETPAGRKFTDLQGWANQYLASRAGQAVLMISGIPVTIKTSPVYA